MVVYEDSPLVRAIAFGRCLVVDECDKCPLEVVMVLKGIPFSLTSSLFFSFLSTGLLEDGELLLSDGRRCVRDHRMRRDKNIIVIHKDFRVIALANRPGFPFLGNNFFNRLGDCFASHIVSNVDEESELEMLRKYGPRVPEYVLKRVVGLFGDLRRMQEEGTLQYPYSLRELVHVVRHLDEYPNEPLSTVLHNVFAVDLANPSVSVCLWFFLVVL